MIKRSISADGDLAVLFTARSKGTQPADFPDLVGGVRPDDTDVFTGGGPLTGGPYGRVAGQMMIQNVVVSLKEKRVLGRLELDEADVCVPPFTSLLQVLWGPANEGWRFGILDYVSKFATRAVLLVAMDGEKFRQTDILSILDEKGAAFVKSKLKGKQGGYALSYSPRSVVKPKVAGSNGNPVKVKFWFGAEVPRSGDDPYIDEGTMTVLLEIGPDKLSAKVLNVEGEFKGGTRG